MAILKFNIVPVINPLTVNAGQDQVDLAGNTTSTTLNGVVAGGVLPIVSISWLQISGELVSIDNPNSLTTQISNLQEGETYEFKLLVTDSANNTANDIVLVSLVASIPSITSISFPNGNCCSSEDVANTESFIYDSSSPSQGDHYLVLTEAMLVANSSLAIGQIESVKITSLPDRGELGVIDTPIINTPQIVSIANINSSLLLFWADNTDGNGQSGDFTTSFSYVLIDTNSNEQDNITLTIFADDSVESLTSVEGVISVADCNTPDGTNRAVDIVSQGTSLVEIGDRVRLKGTTISFDGGNGVYRLTEGLISGQYYKDFVGIIVSDYIVRINTNGIITEIINCN